MPSPVANVLHLRHCVLQYIALYYGRVLVAMVPFDVLRKLYAHNIRLDKVYIIGLDSYFSRFVTVLIKACTELGCVAFYHRYCICLYITTIV